MKQILYILSIVLLSSCAITYEQPKCELILRGEPCLSDHRCCNPPQTYYQQNTYWPWWYKPHYNKTNYIIVNKPNNKPNKPNNRPNKPNNNKPNNTNKHRK